MNHPRHEPLTPEERALAERLARIGPHVDGPPSALDTRILAAAHAAAAPRRRRRWLALTGVPASLVTGAGMAAALALVVGVVWQMRPASGPARAPRSEAGDMGYVSAEMIQRERPAPPAPPPPPEVAVAAAATDAPPPAPAEPAPAKALSPPPAETRREAPVVAAKESAPAPAGHAAADPYLDEAVVDAPAPAAPAGVAPRRKAAPAAAAPASPAPVAAASVAAEPAFVPEPPVQAAPAAASIGTAAAQRKAAAARQADMRAEGDSARERTSGELARMQANAANAALADVPVRDDARLAVEDWLDRIRQRRDQGDLDGARASLMLFRREHPHRRLPDDLRSLPAEPAR